MAERKKKIILAPENTTKQKDKELTQSIFAEYLYIFTGYMISTEQ